MPPASSSVSLLILWGKVPILGMLPPRLTPAIGVRQLARSGSFATVRHLSRFSSMEAIHLRSGSDFKTAFGTLRYLLRLLVGRRRACGNSTACAMAGSKRRAQPNKPLASHAPSTVALGVTLLVRLMYHLYQGPIGAVWILGFGLVFGLFYLRFNSLWPVALAHMLWDIVPFTSSQQ